jgi:potassium channel subfamily K
MTSFAVQTVISAMSYFANRRLTVRGKRVESRPHPETDAKKVGDSVFLPHGQLVLDAHKRIEEQSDAVANDTDEQDELDEELNKEIGRMLAFATQMEGHSRRLLVGHLCGSDNPDVILAGNLLKADWNVQRREVLTLLGEDADPNLDLDGDGKGDFVPGARSDIQMGVHTGLATLSEVKKYRISFAGFLVSAASLQRLKGKRRLIFERRRAYNASSEYIHPSSIRD